VLVKSVASLGYAPPLIAIAERCYYVHRRGGALLGVSFASEINAVP